MAGPGRAAAGGAGGPVGRQAPEPVSTSLVGVGEYPAFYPQEGLVAAPTPNAPRGHAATPTPGWPAHLAAGSAGRGHLGMECVAASHRSGPGAAFGRYCGCAGNRRAAFVLSISILGGSSPDADGQGVAARQQRTAARQSGAVVAGAPRMRGISVREVAGGHAR